MEDYEITFRLANEEDAGDILKIYEPYVKNTTISFEYDVPSLEEFKERISHITSYFPYIVCEYGREIIGYAYASKFNERAAYQWNVELSIYIKENFTGYGLGKRMYKIIMDILKLQNIKNAYSRVAASNIESEKLHENFGFNKISVFKNTGYKLGKWIDLIWYVKDISEGETAPNPPIIIHEISQSRLMEILNNSVITRVSE